MWASMRTQKPWEPLAQEALLHTSQQTLAGLRGGARPEKVSLLVEAYGGKEPCCETQTSPGTPSPSGQSTTASSTGGKAESPVTQRVPGETRCCLRMKKKEKESTSPLERSREYPGPRLLESSYIWRGRIISRPHSWGSGAQHLPKAQLAQKYALPLPLPNPNPAPC